MLMWDHLHSAIVCDIKFMHSFRYLVIPVLINRYVTFITSVALINLYNFEENWSFLLKKSLESRTITKVAFNIIKRYCLHSVDIFYHNISDDIMHPVTAR
jgi:hypothetical protein